MPDVGRNIPKGATAALVMADGMVFFGKGIGSPTTGIGEICFNTSLTGYQEVLTDPSYTGQIINFTFPHIGNVGVNEDDVESLGPVASGLIIREDITNPANFRSNLHFNSWLEKKQITGICAVDTRAITRHIRMNGAQNVAIYHFGNGKPDIGKILEELRSHPSMEGMELATGVSATKQYVWDKPTWKLGRGTINAEQGKYKVVAIDYGMKLNILRCLVSIGCDVTVVPARTGAEEILKLGPDGIFLSNGPGDPSATAEYAVAELQKLIASDVPIFGICLGHQLLAMALGCSAAKMHQGHRGANHPVQDLKTGKVEITSQNHGFTIVKNNLPEDVEVTHISLFDGTIEGIKSKTKSVFSVQYHPESSPGPHDSSYLFGRFLELMRIRTLP